MWKIFVDGSAGTTGLRIADRLSGRTDAELMRLDETLRKDQAARREALNSCDIAFLCLPDAAAIEAAALVENPHVRILDTSTAHRCAEGWVYGFPELDAELRERILSAKRIAVPGCHASGFIALVRPLIAAGLLSEHALLSAYSLTGYSGGGKKMIAQYEDAARAAEFGAPRQYGLSQTHKHLPEMQRMTRLSNAPVFCPVVGDFYSGMQVTVPVFDRQLKGGAGISEILTVYRAAYPGPVVSVKDLSCGGFLAANAAAGTDRMYISVQGNDSRILLTATYDNLGKGASGAAVQLMNLLIGAEETTGLEGFGEEQ